MSITLSRITRQRSDSIFVVIAGCAAGLAALVIGATVTYAAANDSSRRTVAIVDGHAITEQDLDNTIALRLYQLRSQALDQFIDNYLLEQAARRANLAIPEYLDKESTVTVSEADARAQYDKYKYLNKVPFEQLKPRLIASLTAQRRTDLQSALRTKLRSEARVEIDLAPPRFEVAIAHNPSIGLASAPVTIVEFEDFQSPFCLREESALQQVRDLYRDQVRLVFKDFPQLTSKEATEAAEAARCANEQGKFWQFRDALYTDQSKLAVPDLKATARGLGLNSAKFDSCLDTGKYSSAIEADIEEGLRLGITGMPTFVINGHPHPGLQSAVGFKQMIDQELEGKSRTQTKSH